MLALEATCATLTDSNVKLLAKVTDLESRSRRNNIRIVGLPESIEGPHPSTFFPKLLMEVFGEGVFGEGVLDSPPEYDRAHRSLTDKPKPGQRSRPVTAGHHHPRPQVPAEGENYPRGPGQERQATVPRYVNRHLRGLHTRSDGTALQIPRVLGKHNSFRPPSLDSPYD
ncbi:hypothetical protein KUCAC02_031023 [Chaenocephalus aceratus]|uniref:Uncharacterized protein n=1 Tax=Chaenocephalus aceratus TaxID=36190 RepID=A0ACB9XML3_CHAAC|nr:hypothetical protein KUCAC02_031023 [Chaenocephalus aceratus]